MVTWDITDDVMFKMFKMNKRTVRTVSSRKQTVSKTSKQTNNIFSTEFVGQDPVNPPSKPEKVFSVGNTRMAVFSEDLLK